MTHPTIHLTGGLGFIGSNLIRHLNGHGITPFVYDRLEGETWRNVAGLSFHLRDWRDVLRRDQDLPCGQVLIHLGARVDTTEPFSQDLWETNVEFSLRLFRHFQHCRVVYASSAAVYGAEEHDFTERLYGLQPLNAYAFTKLALDQAVFGRAPLVVPLRAYGLRFFNVYGPNEGHKGAMASVVHKALAGKLSIYDPRDRCGPDQWSLFKSHRASVADGEQRRDFVHVDDVCQVLCHFALSDPAPQSGVYNVGSGVARSFNELVRAIDPGREVVYHDTPANLRAQYQYHTCADLARLRAAGYDRLFLSLEDGISRARDAA